MRNVTSLALVSGPLVLLSYLVASAAQHRASRDERRAVDLAFEAFIAVASATFGWTVARRLSPGGTITYSTVGFYSDEVLAAWQSIALWCGLGAVIGTCAPVFRGFRGSHGHGAAVALLAVYAPLLALVWLFGFGVGLAVRGDDTEARLCALAPILPLAWLAWLFGWPGSYGLPPGPEVTLWAMVLSGVLFTRWWIDR